MKKEDFINLTGLADTDTVSVSAKELQLILRENDSLKDENTKNISYIGELCNEIKQLKNDISILCKAAVTNKQLIKENDKLKYQLSLSNMFLKRRREREQYEELNQPLKVDLMA